MNNIIISKIFIIHLKESIKREIHIKNEFKRMELTNYEIFDAISGDSKEVKDKFNSGFVKKPPCFRCSLSKCKHVNKVLNKRQIGNWCSYINLMKKIVDEKISGLIMICEDDIKFMMNYHVIMDKLITKEVFDQYKIDINKPILIRLGGISCKKQIHPYMKRLKLIKKKVMSNPCFLINLQFAESFINNLRKINTTSDIFIHIKLINIDNNIQDFTLIPQIAHDLSYGPIKKFKSTIRV